VTRRELELIARVLGSAPIDDDTLARLAEHFMRALAEREPSFNRTQFLSALLEAATERHQR